MPRPRPRTADIARTSRPAVKPPTPRRRSPDPAARTTSRRTLFAQDPRQGPRQSVHNDLRPGRLVPAEEAENGAASTRHYPLTFMAARKPGSSASLVEKSSAASLNACR